MTEAYEEKLQLERAKDTLQNLVGESVDTIYVNSVSREEAPFLGRIVSKLSPMVGNLMEQRIVSILGESTTGSYSWERQDPGFPDAILKDKKGRPTATGIEIKAWYVLSTEITGRFRESVKLLQDRNIDVVIIAWCMSNLVFGQPKILGILSVPGTELAESRDRHYHNPPEYLTIEPEDTTGRTSNLQQSNVNGYKLQADESDATKLDRLRIYYDGVRDSSDESEPPHSITAQKEADNLRNELKYRLDTNFAKIDRVDNPSVELFKQKILTSEYLGKSISQWKRFFADLTSKDEKRRSKAEKIFFDFYAEMASVEPTAEVIIED